MQVAEANAVADYIHAQSKHIQFRYIERYSEEQYLWLKLNELNTRRSNMFQLDNKHAPEHPDPPIYPLNPVRRGDWTQAAASSLDSTHAPSFHYHLRHPHITSHDVLPLRLLFPRESFPSTSAPFTIHSIRCRYTSLIWSTIPSSNASSPSSSFIWRRTLVLCSRVNVLPSIRCRTF